MTLLPERLLEFDDDLSALAKRFDESGTALDDTASEELRAVVKQLDASRRLLLSVWLWLMDQVSVQHHTTTRLSRSSIAMCLAPTLVVIPTAPDDMSAYVVQLKDSGKLLTALLTRYDEWRADDNDASDSEATLADALVIVKDALVREPRDAVAQAARATTESIVADNNDDEKPTTTPSSSSSSATTETTTNDTDTSLDQSATSSPAVALTPIRTNVPPVETTSGDVCADNTNLHRQFGACANQNLQHKKTMEDSFVCIPDFMPQSAL